MANSKKLATTIGVLLASETDLHVTLRKDTTALLFTSVVVDTRPLGALMCMRSADPCRLFALALPARAHGLAGNP